MVTVLFWVMVVFAVGALGNLSGLLFLNDDRLQSLVGLILWHLVDRDLRHAGAIAR